MQLKDGKPILIAIVDDHIDTVTSLSNFLESQGFKTVWAYSGEDAIDLCKKNKPDLLLTDIRMPGMSGFELAEKLKDQPKLFMTAYDNMEEKAKKYKPSWGIIKKPVDVSELLEIIKKNFKLKDKEI